MHRPAPADPKHRFWRRIGNPAQFLHYARVNYGCAVAVKARAGWTRNSPAATIEAVRRVNCLRLGLTISRTLIA